MKPITPVVVGRGMAGRAILQSLAIVSDGDKELDILESRIAERGQPFSSLMEAETANVLFLANPHGLHTSSIVQGIAAGYDAVAVEKPICVLPEELDALSGIHSYVSVYHGYRTLWGPRTIKGMIDNGDLGDVFCIETRYWQSSSAERALNKCTRTSTWKDDIRLNGPRDTLVDLGSHAVDMCLYFMKDDPIKSRYRLFYRNAASAHRDTHVHLCMEFPQDRRAICSLSKTLHGAGNDLEFTVLGTLGAATWKFLRADEVLFGTGNRSVILSREGPNPSSGSLPFHGLGWVEGYVEITRQTLRHVSGLASSPIPVLPEARRTMDALFRAEPDV
jgi:predicted dehydrogenase